jgi:hypothetical protein
MLSQGLVESMQIPKRFALSTLLLLMFLVASIFGFAQWRRQALITEANEFREKGVEGVYIRDSWFWPSLMPSNVSVRCLSYSPTIYSPPTFMIQDAVVSAEDAKVFYADIAERLDEIGYEEGRVTFRWDHYVSSTHHRKEFKDVRELTQPFYDEQGRK